MHERHLNAALCVLAATLAAAPAVAERRAIAVFRDWGAFEADDPRRCFAVAEPPPGTAAEGRGAFAAVSSRPETRIRAQIAVRLSRGHRPGTRVTLTIGDSGFPLVADARDAWAHDRRQDAEIVAAMRSGSSMSVSAVAADGTPYADVYRLRGAATAIDAAMLACPFG